MIFMVMNKSELRKLIREVIELAGGVEVVVLIGGLDVVVVEEEEGVEIVCVSCNSCSCKMINDRSGSSRSIYGLAVDVRVVVSL